MRPERPVAVIASSTAPQSKPRPAPPSARAKASNQPASRAAGAQLAFSGWSDDAAAAPKTTSARRRTTMARGRRLVRFSPQSRHS